MNIHLISYKIPQDIILKLVFGTHPSQKLNFLVISGLEKRLMPS